MSRPGTGVRRRWKGLWRQGGGGEGWVRGGSGSGSGERGRVLDQELGSEEVQGKGLQIRRGIWVWGLGGWSSRAMMWGSESGWGWVLLQGWEHVGEGR